MPASFSFRLPRSAGELVYALVAAGLLSGMLISLPLWLTGRAFPHLPVFAFFPPFPKPVDAFFFWLVAAVLGLSAFLPDRPAAARNAIGGCVILALQDQMRWQPWFYQYLLMLVFAALAGGRRAPAFLPACRILIAGLYFWSGLHKLTSPPAYDHMFQATFTEPLSAVWPGWAAQAVRASAPAGPWVEMGLAVLLCVPRTRRAGVLLATAVHAGILLLIGPAGTHTNEVVWPWNLIMPALVFLLFWRVPEGGSRAFWPSDGLPAAPALAFLAAVILPAFSIREKWDRYLSFHLYSGSERRLLILLDAPSAAAVPETWRPYLTPSAHRPGVQELHFLPWALAELGVPPPGDQRHLLALARKCAAMPFAREGMVRFYTDYPFLLNERGWDVYSPDAIRQMREIPPLTPRSNATGTSSSSSGH